MKKSLCCLLSFLILICVIYINLFSFDNNGSVKVVNSIKYVDSAILTLLNSDVNSAIEEMPVFSEDILVDEEVNDKIEEHAVSKDVDVIEENGSSDENKVVENTNKDTLSNNEVITGKMTGYGPDCSGCSGYLAYGTYVGDGTIYYNDSEYGSVRIVAGDKKYKFGTIVRINDSLLAIVLDRGGCIGIGKKFLFDLLYASEKEANTHGVMSDFKFEILRNGF